jgi:hypothetical protein
MHVKSIVVVSIILGAHICKAQDNGHKYEVNPTAINALIENKKEYIKLSNGEYTSGFRIKIHSGIDKDKASYSASKFKSIYADMAYYEKYQQPNFTVTIGDFKNKFEAYKCLQEIKSNFPLAFIVKEKIRAHRVK